MQELFEIRFESTWFANLQCPKKEVIDCINQPFCDYETISSFELPYIKDNFEINLFPFLKLDNDIEKNLAYLSIYKQMFFGQYLELILKMQFQKENSLNFQFFMMKKSREYDWTNEKTVKLREVLNKTFQKLL